MIMSIILGLVLALVFKLYIKAVEKIINIFRIYNIAGDTISFRADVFVSEIITKLKNYYQLLTEHQTISIRS